VLRPIAPDDPDLPDDVRALIGSLHERAPWPSIIPPHKPASRVLGRVDEFDEDDDADLDAALEELDELPLTARPTATVPALDRWSVQAHVYSSEVAAKLSILAGLFGGSGKRAKAGATHEAKRYRVEITDAQREVQIGVAVRLAVATTEWEVDAELSVPNIAAAAQLNAKVGDAKIGIDVVGYSGPLGDMLPAPRQLDVTTLADYLAAFSAIQRRVFGRDGGRFLTPTALSYDDPRAEQPG
jgi:hypothetical protein